MIDCVAIDTLRRLLSGRRNEFTIGAPARLRFGSVNTAYSGMHIKMHIEFVPVI